MAAQIDSEQQLSANEPDSALGGATRCRKLASNLALLDHSFELNLRLARTWNSYVRPGSQDTLLLAWLEHQIGVYQGTRRSWLLELKARAWQKANRKQEAAALFLRLLNERLGSPQQARWELLDDRLSPQNLAQEAMKCVWDANHPEALLQIAADLRPRLLTKPARATLAEDIVQFADGSASLEAAKQAFQDLLALEPGLVGNDRLTALWVLHRFPPDNEARAAVKAQLVLPLLSEPARKPSQQRIEAQLQVASELALAGRTADAVALLEPARTNARFRLLARGRTELARIPELMRFLSSLPVDPPAAAA